MPLKMISFQPLAVEICQFFMRVAVKVSFMLIGVARHSLFKLTHADSILRHILRCRILRIWRHDAVRLSRCSLF